MNKYTILMETLEKTGTGTMKCFGNSMLPKLSNPSINTYKKEKKYSVGDIVFCKVKGKYIDAHLITAISSDGKYLISNNKNHDNGWTKTIYGKVIKSIQKNGEIKLF